MTRFAAGSWPHEADGVVIHLEAERVDRGMVRLLIAAVRAAGLTPDDVFAVEFPDETTGAGAVTVEYRPAGYVYNIVRRTVSVPLTAVLAEARGGAA